MFFHCFTRVVAFAILATLPIYVASAETVNVKYRGPVDLDPFVRELISSSFIGRVCYDESNSYMLISLECRLKRVRYEAILRAAIAAEGAS